MSGIDKLRAVATDKSLTMTQRHRQIRAIDPIAGNAFATLNAPALALESRRADEVERAMNLVEAAELRAMLPPAPTLDRYEELRGRDSVAAALFYKAHSMRILAERDERMAAIDALNPGPDAA
jgi:hypothetical protein